MGIIGVLSHHNQHSAATATGITTPSVVVVAEVAVPPGKAKRARVTSMEEV